MYYSRDVNCEKSFGQPGDLVVSLTKYCSDLCSTDVLNSHTHYLQWII